MSTATTGGLTGLVARALRRLRRGRRAHLSQLDTPLDRVAYLRDVRGLRVDEIAAELGLSRSQVERALFSSRKGSVNAIRYKVVSIRRRSG